MKRLIPHSGKTVDIGDPRLNIRRFEPGERILYRSEGGRWLETEILVIAETGVIVPGLTSAGAPFTVPFKCIAGKVPEGVDAVALATNLTALERRALAAVQTIRDDARETMLALIESELQRTPPFVPGFTGT